MESSHQLGRFIGNYVFNENVATTIEHYAYLRGSNYCTRLFRIGPHLLYFSNRTKARGQTYDLLHSCCRDPIFAVYCSGLALIWWSKAESRLNQV